MKISHNTLNETVKFLSNMSHDIRIPMNGIMGMTSVAISSLDNPSRVRSCLRKIHISSRHLLGLINDMLDMSKIETGKLTLNMEPLCIRDIMQNIETVIQPLVQEKNQHFNILGNAVKFTPEGGTIEVDLCEEASPKGNLFQITIDMRKTAHQEKQLQLPMRNVLVIDDDEKAGNLTVASLESIGLKAKMTADMQQAFRMIEECRGKNENYHMVLLDWDIQEIFSLLGQYLQ